MSVPSFLSSARSSSTLARARVGIVSIVQLPFLAVFAALALGMFAWRPSISVDPTYLTAVALAVLGSVAGLVIPWERSGLPLVSIVPVVDIVAVALLRDAVHPQFVLAGMIMIFPAVWLSSVLGAPGIAAAVVGAVFVTVLPYLSPTPAPHGVDTWSDLLLTPVIVGVISALVGFTVGTRGEVAGRWQSVGAQLAASRTAIAETEMVLQTVADTVEAAIIMYDRSGTVVLSNQRAKDLYVKAGMVPVEGELPRPRVYRADGVTPVPFGRDVIERTLGGVPLDGQVYWIGDGSDRSAVMAMSQAMDSPVGGKLGTVVVAHDVTQLMDSIGIRDQFLANVSHELKTPLTSILGYVDLIDAPRLGIGTEVTVIAKNAERLLALVSDLLAAGGAEKTIHRSPMNLSTLVERAVESVAPTAAAAGITVSFSDVEGGAFPVVAEIDANAIRQVVDNLLSNAVKFTPAGGTVTVSLVGNDHDATLRVADTGPGIPPTERAQVFERFYRSRTAREAAVPGAGLGLAIAKDAVEAHGGSISVDSTVGQGAVFTVRLPLRASGLV